MKRKPTGHSRRIAQIFNKFAGQEVAMTEETKTLKLEHLGDYTYTEVKPANDKDPVLEAMQKEAAKNGLSLRVWWPGIAGTADYREDRVNAHIEKGADNKWRIAKLFDIG
jgi:hypothetical protein